MTVKTETDGNKDTKDEDSSCASCETGSLEGEIPDCSDSEWSM